MVDENLVPRLVEAKKRREEDAYLRLIVEIARAREKVPADTEAGKLIDSFLHIVAVEIKEHT